MSAGPIHPPVTIPHQGTGSVTMSETSESPTRQPRVTHPHIG